MQNNKMYLTKILNEKGKPSERAGRKADGLMADNAADGGRVAGEREEVFRPRGNPAMRAMPESKGVRREIICRTKQRGIKKYFLKRREL
jgi:hypothetical protein